MVPRYEDGPDGRVVHGTVERLEEKLGHHGSATCVINFDGAPAQLVGERGEGFRLMLLLMNNARIGVGFESIGLCEAAYRAALDYARTRPSMGKTIDRHEMIADYLDEMRTDIQGLRAIGMYSAYHEEMAHKSRLALQFLVGDDAEARERLDRAAKRHARRARATTPLLKYLAAEKAVEMARRSVQIHGGVGYTKEYPAEKLLRDSMVMPIYEGTSQIQSLMVMKDALTGIMRNPQRFVRKLAQARWRSVSARDPLERQLARVQSMALTAQQQLIQRTAADKLRGLSSKPITSWSAEFFKNWDPKRDFAHAQLHAERLTRIMADAAIGQALWAQARRDPARREVMARYLERAEPRARYQLDQIGTLGERLLRGLARDEDGADRDTSAAQ